MLGWEIFVFRNSSAKREDLIVHWMTSVSGLDWINQLVKEGKAIELEGDGYPYRYEVLARILIPILSKDLPVNSSPQVLDDYAQLESWSGSIAWRQDPVVCADDCILLLEVWDQS